MIHYVQCDLSLILDTTIHALRWSACNAVSIQFSYEKSRSTEYLSCLDMQGRDRYPYPVGYQATRLHGGHDYRLEVAEGPNGPDFVVSSLPPLGGRCIFGTAERRVWPNYKGQKEALMAATKFQKYWEWEVCELTFKHISLNAK
jgi:hypothetical protein